MSDTEISDAARSRLRGAMKSYVDREERPGVVTVLANHRETHVDAVGQQAFGGDRPMQRDTIFRIASITKPVVAAAALTLVQEGRVRLEEPIDG